jgi:hypothetical protein
MKEKKADRKVDKKKALRAWDDACWIAEVWGVDDWKEISEFAELLMALRRNREKNDQPKN